MTSAGQYLRVRKLHLFEHSMLVLECSIELGIYFTNDVMIMIRLK